MQYPATAGGWFKACLEAPTLVHTRTTPDMQPEEMSFEMIKRMTAAISDLESLRSFA